MREFNIRAVVNVYKDNYIDGKFESTENVDYYETEASLVSKNKNEALKEFFILKYGFILNIDDVEFDLENNCFNYVGGFGVTTYNHHIYIS